ncbi:MAG: SagB/ThcOx family dehydrogenase [Thermodesulfobacteriota bacterium]|nr:SagB/ThcOx family dehydrogenase [Thermodesulfobacteriota bacterium]
MDDLSQSLGYKYFEETKFQRATIHFKKRPMIEPADSWKEYPEAPKFSLPKINVKEVESDLWQILQKRRSLRKFSEKKMKPTDLSLLLWASQGITAQAGNFLLRTAPSAGALYPIETYLSVQNVDGIPAGLYHFHIREFQLEQLSAKLLGKEVAESALDQNFIVEAGVTFIWSAVFRRNMSKYGHRGMRYICLDAGHICQNLLLAAEALGLATCPVAAFYDDELNNLFGLDSNEENVLYLAAVGCK